MGNNREVQEERNPLARVALTPYAKPRAVKIEQSRLPATRGDSCLMRSCVLIHCARCPQHTASNTQVII